MRLLISGANIGGAGSTVVATALMKALVERFPSTQFIAVVPPQLRDVFRNAGANLELVIVDSLKLRWVSRLCDVHWRVRRLCKSYRAGACLSLGDVGPSNLSIPHVVLVQQFYLANVGTAVERSWSPLNRIRFAYLRRHFRRMCRRGVEVVVQTPVIADALTETFQIPPQRLHVVPMALPEHARPNAEIVHNPVIAGSPKPCKLLFLANLGPHKNASILAPVLERLTRRGLDRDVHVFLTADQRAGVGVYELLEHLRPWQNMVTNLGLLPPSAVLGSLAASTALFLPTLFESFGLVYLEALAAGTRILTSDRPFARWVCGETALYFDPLDPDAICDVVEGFAKGASHIFGFDTKAAKHLGRFPGSWTQVAELFMDIVTQAIARAEAVG